MVELSNELKSVQEVVDLIEEGRHLVINGEAKLFEKLPKGNWIGATQSYFYLDGKKGCFDESKLFVSDFTDISKDIKILTYTEENIKDVPSSGFDNGFNFLVLPALSDIHLSFALNSPKYKQLYKNPLLGLIAGTSLEKFSKGEPSKVFNGKIGESYTNKGVALHVELAESLVARLEIVNVFEADTTATIEVEQTGFIIEECLVDGVKTNLYDYLQKHNLDISFPLVCDYNGAMINTSFQRLEDNSKKVVFYAPLFEGKTYKFAKPLKNYAEQFRAKVEKAEIKKEAMIYNCNCILNYAYGELEKEDIGFSGPTTFGEIAYHLINQTFTYLLIDEK